MPTRILLRFLTLGLVLAAACSSGTPSPKAAGSKSTESSDPWGDAHSLSADSRRANRLTHASLRIPVSDEDPQWGRADAPVTIVQFADLQCPFSARVQPTLRKLQEEYGPDRLRIVWKNHPMPFHKEAPPAHATAIAVHRIAGSEAFFQFQRQAFENQKRLNQESFESWASELGVSAREMLSEVELGRSASKVEKDQALAKELKASGVPSFFINGVALPGAQPLEKFRAIIETELRVAQRLTDNGLEPLAVYPVRLDANFTLDRKVEKKKKDPPDLTVWKIPVAADDPALGKKDALVTIVEFAEFQCPFSRRVTATLDRIRSTYGDDVRLVWKDNPLGFHPEAKPAALVGRYVYEKKGVDAFWRVHERLFGSQEVLGDKLYEQIFREEGLSFATFQRAKKQYKYSKKLDQSQDLADDFKARGTPHFFINGRRLMGAQSFETFKELIDEQLALARQRVEKGTRRGDVYSAIMKDAFEPPSPEPKVVAAPLADTPYQGNPNAKIVVQAFGDFECPFTARAQPTIEEFLKLHGREVKFVWRHYPLPFHKQASLAAEAAHEAYVQKGNRGFWAFHELLFENQRDGMERAKLEKYAQQIGLDMAAFRRALDERTHTPRIEADREAARAAGINGTPSFVVDDVFISGAQPLRAFVRALKEAKK